MLVAINMGTLTRAEKIGRYTNVAMEFTVWQWIQTWNMVFLSNMWESLGIQQNDVFSRIWNCLGRPYEESTSRFPGAGFANEQVQVYH